MGCSLSSIVFQPPHPNNRASVSSLSLTTRHGNRIPAVFLNGNHHHTILLSHCNAEDLQRVEDWVRRVMAPRVKANVLLYEYTGYGGSQVQPSEDFVYSDCEAAIWFLTSCLKITLHNIVLFGRSIGSGPACYLAEKYPDVSGLILQTPLTSVLRVVLDFRFTVPDDMFPNIDRIRNVHCPVLLLHGTRDEVVSMRHSEQLLSACPHSNKILMLVDGAGHNDIDLVAGAPMFQVMQNFLDSLQDRTDANHRSESM